MIEVKVAEYCHECEIFRPDCHTSYWDSFSDRNAKVIHVITCGYAEECNRIKQYLEKKLTEKE